MIIIIVNLALIRLVYTAVLCGMQACTSLVEAAIILFFIQFCATRKGTQQAASILIKDARFVMNPQHKQRLVGTSLKDAKLRGAV